MISTNGDAQRQGDEVYYKTLWNVIRTTLGLVDLRDNPWFHEFGLVSILEGRRSRLFIGVALFILGFEPKYVPHFHHGSITESLPPAFYLKFYARGRLLVFGRESVYTRRCPERIS